MQFLTGQILPKISPNINKSRVSNKAVGAGILVLECVGAARNKKRSRGRERGRWRAMEQRLNWTLGDT